MATQIGDVRLSDGTNPLGTETNPIPVTLVPSTQTNGGLAPFSAEVGATTLLVNDDPSLLYGYTIVNTTANIAYLQLFDRATLAEVTLGTTVPDLVIPVPANGSVSLEIAAGLDFGHGIVLASTTARGNATGALTEVLLFWWGILT